MRFRSSSRLIGVGWVWRFASLALNSALSSPGLLYLNSLAACAPSALEREISLLRWACTGSGAAPRATRPPNKASRRPSLPRISSGASAPPPRRAATPTSSESIGDAKCAASPSDSGRRASESRKVRGTDYQLRRKLTN
eukprot:scaffold46735_cov32-Tisochrysis_lutea.AAC.1